MSTQNNQQLFCGSVTPQTFNEQPYHWDAWVEGPKSLNSFDYYIVFLLTKLFF